MVFQIVSLLLHNEPSAPPAPPTTSSSVKWFWSVLGIVAAIGLYFYPGGFVFPGIALVAGLILSIVPTQWHKGALTIVALTIVSIVAIIMSVPVFGKWSLVAIGIMGIFASILTFQRGELYGVTVAFTFILTTGYIVMFLTVPGSPISESFSESVIAATELFTSAQNTIVDAPDKIGEFTSRSIAQAQGRTADNVIVQSDILDVDPGAEIKTLDVPDQVDSITDFWLYSDIEVATLDDNIDLFMTCDIDGITPQQYLPASQSFTFDIPGVATTEQGGCFYPAGSVPAGTHTAKVQIYHSFGTAATIDGSFADANYLQNLRRNKKDLEEEGLITKPKGKQLPAPIQVGLKLKGSQPKTLRRGIDNIVSFDVILDKQKNGRITFIDEFVMMMPVEMPITAVTMNGASVDFREATCAELTPRTQRGCEGALQTVYTIIPPTDEELLKTLPLTFTITSVIPQESYDLLLGGSDNSGLSIPGKTGGATTERFIASIDYQFTTEKKKVFTVRDAVVELS